MWRSKLTWQHACCALALTGADRHGEHGGRRGATGRLVLQRVRAGSDVRNRMRERRRRDDHVRRLSRWRAGVVQRRQLPPGLLAELPALAGVHLGQPVHDLL